MSKVYWLYQGGDCNDIFAEGFISVEEYEEIKKYMKKKRKKKIYIFEREETTLSELYFSTDEKDINEYELIIKMGRDRDYFDLMEHLYGQGIIE